MRCATEWTLIDTETTGLFAPIHVVEVAAVRMRGWEPTGETFQAFLDHDIEIPARPRPSMAMIAPSSAGTAPTRGKSIGRSAASSATARSARTT